MVEILTENRMEIPVEIPMEIPVETCKICQHDPGGPQGTCIMEWANTEGGIFEARVSPGSFLYLYIFLHLFHMFLYMLFVFFV